MDVTTLPSVRGVRHKKKRVGRGVGSGHGKTATRGQKGQKSRTGSRKRPGFEGGRSPLIRRLPKRGFKVKATGQDHRVTEVINVEQLNRVTDGEKLTLKRLKELGFIRHVQRPVILLGDGDLKKRVAISVHRASASAQAKVQKAGGTIELIDN